MLGPKFKIYVLLLCGIAISLIILVNYEASMFYSKYHKNVHPRLFFGLWKSSEKAIKIEVPLERTIRVRNGNLNSNISFTYKVYKPMHSFNNATFVMEGCSSRENTDKFVLITGFIDLKSNTYRRTLGNLADSSEENNAKIEARLMEVIDVLQSNLNHTLIDEIHILVRDRETAEYLHSLPLKRSEKLVLRVVNEDVGLKCQLIYAARCLPGQYVAITNQDNKVGKGWDLPWRKVIGDSSTVYALTRHPALNSNCTKYSKHGTCDDGEIYFGSHDTFVVKAMKEWSESTFQELKGISPDLPGMENLFIWFFQTKMKYRVLNPCKLLFVHHHHCVPIRGTNRHRVNSGGRSAVIGFSDNLQA